MIANNKIKPIALRDIEDFHKKIKNRESFCFIRFSDGETEIIRNRYLKISGGKTHFKGKIFDNNFSDIDSKEFDPNSNNDLREDLLISAIKKMPISIKQATKEIQTNGKLLSFRNGKIWNRNLIELIIFKYWS